MNTTNTATRLIAGAIFTALASSLSTTAGAAENTGAPQETVKYTVLGVSTAQGAATLYNHIRFAADHVCASLNHGDLSSQMRVKACNHTLIEDAVSRVNQPALSAVYNERNGASSPLIVAAK
jgi:UrcA family protein